jgi:hypothetical protein
MLALSRELADAKCGMARESFEDLVIRVYREQFENMPDEQMVREPRRAHQFCNRVREEVAAPRLPDPVILGTMQNLRKAARLIVSRKRRAEPTGAEAAEPAPKRRPGRPRRVEAGAQPAVFA